MVELKPKSIQEVTTSLGMSIAGFDRLCSQSCLLSVFVVIGAEMCENPGTMIFGRLSMHDPNRKPAMKMPKAFKKVMLILMATILAACGGGSDAPVSPVAGYLGSWGFCNGAGQMDRLLISQGASASDLLIKQETTFHAKADCSDSAGATLFFSGASTAASRKGTVAVSLAQPGTSARTVDADRFNAVTTGGSLRVVSSGLLVDYTKTSNTRGQWCINGVAGTNYCFYEDDEIMESGEDNLGLYLEGSQLHTFEQDEKTGAFTQSITFKRL